jgi:hypothetical protein
MFNVALFSFLVCNYYEELPVASFDNSPNVVIVKRTGVFRRRTYVEVPVATVGSNSNIVKTTIVETKVVEPSSKKTVEIVTERPIFPRVNSAVRNMVAPRMTNPKEIIIEESPNEIKIEKKVTTSSNGKDYSETTTETTTTYNSDMIVEQRRGLFGRVRFRYR